MRFVSSVMSAYTGYGGREVKGLVDVRAVKPVRAREQAVAVGAQHKRLEYLHETKQREVPEEERRKACRRVDQQPVLVDLRSGIDRRRHNLREGDVVEHIDVEA